jgi:hypothetical protein
MNQPVLDSSASLGAACSRSSQPLTEEGRRVEEPQPRAIVEPGIGPLLRTLAPGGGERIRLLWIGNFEAERFWASSRSLRLPSVAQASDLSIANRLEEMTLFLAEAPDVVILRHASDPAFSHYVADLGLKPPQIVTADPADNNMPIAETVLRNDELCSGLKQLAEQGPGLYLLPYATTRLEEQIASTIGISCLGASAAVSEKVNSKIYSRRVSRQAGLRTVPGGECESIEDIEHVYRDLVATDSHTLVLKESMGVSGRGLLVIDAPAKMQNLLSLLKRRHTRDSQVDFVFERWIDKTRDINYQIFVSPSGEVSLVNIKEAVTKNGVHMGHHWPPPLDPGQHGCYLEAANAIGAQLYADGFTGIAGIDSIIDRQGLVYPVLEINARFNMSTYELRLDEMMDSGLDKIVKYYPLVLNEPLNFNKLSSSLGNNMFTRHSRLGIGVFCFATANCNFRPGASLPVKGRIYVFIAGRNAAEVERLDSAMVNALHACGAQTSI